MTNQDVSPEQCEWSPRCILPNGHEHACGAGREGLVAMLVEDETGEVPVSEHNHRTFVEGCFRCDLSRDEASVRAEPVPQPDIEALIRDLLVKEGEVEKAYWMGPRILDYEEGVYKRDEALDKVWKALRAQETRIKELRGGSKQSWEVLHDTIQAMYLDAQATIAERDTTIERLHNWEAEAVGALESATIINERCSCKYGRLNLANHDRLVREGKKSHPVLAALEATSD